MQSTGLSLVLKIDDKQEIETALKNIKRDCHHYASPEHLALCITFNTLRNIQFHRPGKVNVTADMSINLHSRTILKVSRLPVDILSLILYDKTPEDVASNLHFPQSLPPQHIDVPPSVEG